MWDFKVSSFREFYVSYRVLKVVCLEIFRFPFEEESKNQVTNETIFHFPDTKSSTRKSYKNRDFCERFYLPQDRIWNLLMSSGKSVIWKSRSLRECIIYNEKRFLTLNIISRKSKISLSLWKALVEILN